MRKTIGISHAAERISQELIRLADLRPWLCVSLLAAGMAPGIHAQSGGTADAKESASSLKLWGPPGEVRLVSADPSVKVRVSLNVIAENTGKESLLLLRRTPASDSEEIVSVASPAAPVWRQDHGAGPRTNSDPELTKLRRTLDQQEPPEDDVIALGPGDSIGWNVVVQLDIAKGGGASDWDAIRKACPCAVKLDLDLWPMALEPSGDRSDSGFGRKISKKWRKKGGLVFTRKQTEPIEIKFPEK